MSEFFTPKQEELAVALITTKTVAKVTRRPLPVNGEYGPLYNVDRPTSPVDFAINDEEFALTAHRENIAAPLSPYYINLRNLPDDLLTLAYEVIADEIPDEIRRNAVITGIPKAGDPIGEGISKATGMDLVTVFSKEPLTSSVRFSVAPDADQGDGRNLILGDDLITEAATKIDAAKVAKEAKWHVSAVAVLLDREQGGAQQLEAARIALIAPFKWSRLQEFYKDKNLISPEQYQKSMAYFSQVRK